MGKYLFTNNASSILAASFDDTEVSVQLAATDGDLFPAITGDDYFNVTVIDDDGNREIMKCTARSGDILTVVRGQEGTTARAFVNGQARVELRVTAATLTNQLQRSGDSMLGDLDMDGNDIIDARLTGDTTVVGGQLVGTAIRGAEDDTSNQILVPSDGGRPTVGGVEIATWDDIGGVGSNGFIAVNMVLMWFGAVVDIPVGFQVCDGTNGTPDMRNRFAIGAGLSYAVNAVGGSGAVTTVTGMAGAHDHGAATEAHQLTVAEMPEHGHRFYSAYNGRSAGGGNPGMYSSGLFGAGDGYQEFDEMASGNYIIERTGGSDSHSHGITAEEGHTHDLGTITTMPPYRALYYIMRVS